MKTIFKNLFLTLFSLLLVLILTETTLRIFGLGNPIIYEKNLLYGYQPKKNQKVKRFRNYNITINSDNFRIYNKYVDYPKEIYFLENNFKFKNFVESQKFVNDVGKISELEGHHTDILFGWGYAKISITTHAIEGLSENDFILAAKIDKISNAWSV